ncbi:hypothetical protein OSB04_031299 [Centaurea solstitialis]|uniref:CCHC-type domain-containing protein n=1 Tax=Centaurea solstitialis TaxID=347529 RepID=A0AA38W7Z6_9ASTR|nr:hypothetical protein OSB04_031299 [Centaurea solstitialis]
MYNFGVINYSLDDLLKHLRIEEETRNRDRKGKAHANVHSMQAGGKGKGKFKSGGPTKKWNLGPQKKAFKRHRQPSGQGNLKRNGKCHVCRETGHYARKCKQRKPRPSAAANAVGEIGKLLVNLTTDEINMLNVTPQIHTVSRKKISWYVDTGATAHVCNDKSKFVNYREIHGKQVSTSNGAKADIAGYGDILLHFTSYRTIRLQSVMHVPTISKSLLSYSRLDGHGFGIRGLDGTIVFLKNEHYIGKAYLVESMYHLSLSDDLEDSVGGPDEGNMVTMDEELGGGSSSESIFVCGSSDETTNQLLGEALLTACHIHNKITSRVIPTGPYKLWKGRKPDLDYFRVWGCVAYYRTPDPKRSKLGARAIKSIFVGYAVNIKAYRLLDKETGVIVESRDVDFFEDKFSEEAENSDRLLDSDIPGTSHDGSKTSQKVEKPRKSTRVRKEKSLGNEFLSYLVEGSHKKVTREIIFSINIDDDPKTFEEAMSSKDASLWREAINDEMDSIMKQPEGFVMPGQENKVCKLVKSLYGLKQAPKQWHERFDMTVTSFGFKHNGADRCIYSKCTKESTVVICLYVDDMLIIGTSLVGILETKNYLSLNFKMKHLGEVDTILGIKFRRSESEISLSQSHYIEKILTKFQHLNIKEFNTPFDSCVKLEKYSGRAVAQLEYASAIGCMMYAMQCTRPDIAFAVSILSEFTINPGPDHWKTIGKILGYLKRTNDLELTYKTHPGILEGYTDASWIDNSNDSKSTCGWIYTLAGGVISWVSKKQTCIAHSTMEAEFIALAAAGKEAEWIRDLLTDLHFWPHPTPSFPMYCDSEATLSKVYNSIYNGKSRHIGLRQNFVRQLIEHGTLSIVYVKSCGKLAGPLTKPLTRELIGSTTRDMGLKPQRISQ